MSIISSANLLLVTDSIGKQRDAADTGLGDGSGSTSGSKGASTNLVRIRDLGDVQQEIALVAPANTVYGELLTASRLTMWDRLVRALESHVGGIDAFLSAAVERVCPQFKEVYEAVVGVPLSARNTFTPEVDPMATFDVTGAGAGTFTDGSAIDNSLYADAHLTLYTSSVIGGTQITATVFVTEWDGSATSKDVVIPNGTGSGVEFDVGAGGDKYIDVTNITIVGGTASDQFKIKAEVERAIAF